MARSRPNPRNRGFVAPEAAPDAAISDLVHDGLLLAIAGVRMAAKNLIIIRALRDHKDFDQAYYVAAVQHEFLTLALEKSTDADRVGEARARAAYRKGTASSQADYRRADLPLLERRITVLTTLAEALTAASQDLELAAGLVSKARETALEEIANAVARETNAADSEHAALEYTIGLSERRKLLIADLWRLPTR